jgi:polar amino acid transport system ATP-binding protein
MEGADVVTNPVLRLVRLQLHRGPRRILAGVTLDVGAGELVAVMGPSGSGKTTILRAITALEPFQAGSITVQDVVLQAGAAVSRETARRLHRTVGMVFQFHCLFEHLSAIENVCLAPVHVHSVPADQAQARAQQLLAAFGVDHRARALPRELSGGEAQRVAIARALAVDPRILLMDEPTASLDPARRGELGETLRRLTGTGRTLLLTTHDDDFVREFATTVAILADGLVVEAGDPAQVLTAPSHPATERLLQTDRRVRRDT